MAAALLRGCCHELGDRGCRAAHVHALPGLLGALRCHTGDAELVRECALALAAFATAGRACCAAARRSCAPAVLLGALRAHCEARAETAGACLAALAPTAQACRRTQRALCAAGALEAVCAALRRHGETDAALAASACACVAALAHTRRGAQRAHQAGALRCLLAAVCAHRARPAVCAAGCAALCALARHGTAGGAVAAAAREQGALEECIVAMRDHDTAGEVQRAAALALRALAASDGHNADAALHAAQLGALQACVVASGLHAADCSVARAQLSTCHALVRAGGYDVQLLALAADAPAAAIYAWQLHPGDRRMCVAAAQVLASLAEALPEGRAACAQLGAQQLAVDALARHAAHAGATVAFLRLLRAAAGEGQPGGLDDPSSPSDAPHAPLKAVLAALRRHAHHAGCATQGTGALRRLLAGNLAMTAGENEEGLPLPLAVAAVRLGSCEALARVLAAHSDDEEVVRAAASAVTQLTQLGGQEAPQRLCACGALAALSAALARHAHDAAVAECVCEAATATLLRGASDSAALSLAHEAALAPAAVAALRGALTSARACERALELLSLLGGAQGDSGLPCGAWDAACAAADMHAESPELSRKFASLARCATQHSPAAAAAAVAAGVCELLAAAMDAHPHELRVAIEAASALGQLGVVPGGRASRAGVRVCCAALETHGSSNAAAAAAAAAALQRLCLAQPSSRARASACDAPSLLCRALWAHGGTSAEAVEACAGCLAALASDQGCAGRCGDAGALGALQTALQAQEGHLGVARAVAAALAATSEQAQRTVRASGPPPPTQRAAGGGGGGRGRGQLVPPPPADPACTLRCTLALLAQHGASDAPAAAAGCRAVAALLPRLGGQGCAECVAEALPLLLAALTAHAGAPDARDAACCALHALLAPSGASPPPPEVRLRALELGALPLVLDCLEEAPAHGGVQASGLALLALLADSPDGEAAAVGDGAVELAVAALVNHSRAPGGAAVAAAAAGALANLSVGAAHVAVLADCGGVEALLGSLAAQRGCAPLASAACAVLRNVAVSPALQRHVAACGGVEAAVRALQEHGPGDALVAERACNALRNAAGEPANERRVADAGGLEALAAVLRLHGNASRLQEAALWAAACVAWSDRELQMRARAAGLPLLATAALETRWRAHPAVCAAARLLLDKTGPPYKWSVPDAIAAVAQASGAQHILQAVVAPAVAAAVAAAKSQPGALPWRPPAEVGDVEAYAAAYEARFAVALEAHTDDDEEEEL